MVCYWGVDIRDVGECAHPRISLPLLVLTREMGKQAGYPPFFTEDGNPMKLYEKIIAVSLRILPSPVSPGGILIDGQWWTTQQGKVRYPTYFEGLAKDLLKNLLTGDLTKRFGNLRGGEWFHLFWLRS